MRDLKKLVVFSLAIASPELILPDLLPSLSQGQFSSLTYAQLQWRLEGFQPSSVRGAISGLKAEGAVTTLQREAKTHIRLTTVGRQLLYSFIPAGIFRRRQWDEAWRLAIFSGVGLSAEAEQRYRVLRRLLAKRGFAQLERGVYVSPYPLSEDDLKLLSKNKALGLLTILETKRFVLGDETEWCRQAWNLDQIGKEYTKLSNQCMRAIVQLGSENGLNQTHKGQFRLYTKGLIQMLEEDPGLPFSLLPEEFGFQDCLKNYLSLAYQIKNRD